MSPLSREIERIWSNPKELQEVVADIGSTSKTEADRNALDCAVASIANDLTFDPMKGCDETPLECIKRIVGKAVEMEAMWRVADQQEMPRRAA